MIAYSLFTPCSKGFSRTFRLPTSGQLAAHRIGAEFLYGPADPNLFTLKMELVLSTEARKEIVITRCENSRERLSSVCGF